MESSTLLAVTVIGTDRPGIVAAVTKKLYELGCNLEDVTSTILRGHFSMVLVVRAREGVDFAEVEWRLRPVAEELGMVITARRVEDTGPPLEPPTHMVSVYGADRPGIVARVSGLLAQLGANITDLNSRLIGGEDVPVYALMLEVSVPEGVQVEQALAVLQRELGVEVSAHSIKADIL